MFDLLKDTGPKPKCLVTTTKLSNFLNHEQPPTKKRPFSTLLDQTFTHTLDLLLPSTTASTLQDTLKNGTNIGTLIYSKLHLKPLDLITNPFFTDYIKSPGASILMLSQGRPDIDPLYSLSNGILRLEVDKPTFEKLGLQGKVLGPEKTLGRKHVKARYAVEVNLRAPGMVHGKPGFERVVWAFKNVLSESCTWLFCDLNGKEDGRGAIKEFAPMVRRVEAGVEKIERAMVPVMPMEIAEAEYSESAEILEWSTLAMMGSPRVWETDDVDPLFSRYRVPSSFGEAQVGELVRLRWRGLIPGQFAYKVFLAAMKASGDQWVAMTGAAFAGDAYTILVKDGHITTWEYKE